MCYHILMSNTRRVDLMDELEIALEIFKSAPDFEFRGLTDAFTDKEIAKIADNVHAGEWRWHAFSYTRAITEMKSK